VKQCQNVSDFQHSIEYVHRPGVKNREIKCLRRQEFNYYQYRDRLNHLIDKDSEEAKILVYKMKEAKERYDNLRICYAESHGRSPNLPDEGR